MTETISRFKVPELADLAEDVRERMGSAAPADGAKKKGKPKTMTPAGALMVLVLLRLTWRRSA